MINVSCITQKVAETKQKTKIANSIIMVGPTSRPIQKSLVISNNFNKSYI